MNGDIQRLLRTAAGFALAAVVVCGAPLLNGCDQAAMPAGGVPTPSRPAEKVYTTRGQITMLPGGSPTAELVIEHEAIDDFINPGGRKGMNSMQMPMLVAPGVSLDGLAVGEKVELDLSVWYAPEFAAVETFRVTRLKKLPADTTLHFGQAAPTLGP